MGLVVARRGGGAAKNNPVKVWERAEGQGVRGRRPSQYEASDQQASKRGAIIQ